ncbi:DNA topoisomerase 3 [subsurface metagenome]
MDFQSKAIVLAEKPSVGKEIARVLGCGKKANGYFEGKDYIVTWAMGHLVELADPHVYDEKYKTWSLDTLPMLPERMKHKVIRKTSHQFKTIKALFQRVDAGSLIIATDAGREGELVARWIMLLGAWKGPFQRLWISSQTDTAIREGFKNLKPGHSYDNLFKAAECRAEADWIVGLNISRALSCKHDARLSAGRVQTPTLAMIIKREQEIAGFHPESFWTVEADFGPFTGTWQRGQGGTRIKDRNRAQEIAEKVRGAEGVIREVTVKDKSEAPPLAYDLTALQRDANSILAFTAKKTLSTLQSLYERHKIVTYPRTDSRYITQDMAPTLKDRLKALFASRYKNEVNALLASDLKPGKRFVDNGKVTDHHAIIPTEEKVYPDKLSAEEKALWDLVVRRFLAVLSPAYRYRSISIVTEAAGELFISRGTQVIDRGWKRVAGPVTGKDLEDEEIPLQNLSSHKRGEVLKVVSTQAKQGFTRLPPRHTEGSLLAAMENPGRFIDNQELRQSIKKGGLGTPATRADIIEKLLSNYYIERKGRELVPTSRGFEVLELVPEKLRSPELTAIWEHRLEAISTGKEKGSSFSRDIRENAKLLVDLVKKSSLEFKPRNVGSTPCPACGKMMLPVLDKKGRKMLICQSLSCGYEQSEKESDSLSRRPSKKEKAMSRRLIQKFSDQSKETSSFAELIKASTEKKNRR